MFTQEDLARLAKVTRFQTKVREAKDLALTIYNDSLLFVFEQGLFKADHNFIVFIRVVSIEKDEVIVNDVNNNPILITDSVMFLERALEVYHEATNAYYYSIKKINEATTVEELIQ